MPGGRPPKWESVEQLEELIEKYFEECANHKKQIVTKEGEIVEVPDPKPLLIEGLVYHLNTNRQTLLDYQDKDQFSDTIKRAKKRIELDVVSRAMTGASHGTVSIFYMKNNMGYKDQQEVAHTGDIEVRRPQRD